MTRWHLVLLVVGFLLGVVAGHFATRRPKTQVVSFVRAEEERRLAAQAEAVDATSTTPADTDGPSTIVDPRISA